MQINPEDASRDIADAVRDARRAQGLRQDDLALAAGISTKTLHNIESGTSGMQVDTLLRVLRVLALRLEITPRAPSMPGRRPGSGHSSEGGEHRG